MVTKVKIDKARIQERSEELSLSFLDKFVRQRQKRPMPIIPDDNFRDLEKLKEIEKANFSSQYVEPRKRHLQEIKELSKSISFADQAAMLVMMELPGLEASTLLHRLGRQIAADPEAKYFSKENLADNCGCGCGCGCSAQLKLSYEERLVSHFQTKPYSIDPFNELGTKPEVRDSLLVKDFLESYEKLSSSVSEKINQRNFRIGRDFGE